MSIRTILIVSILVTTTAAVAPTFVPPAVAAELSTAPVLCQSFVDCSIVNATSKRKTVSVEARQLDGTVITDCASTVPAGGTLEAFQGAVYECPCTAAPGYVVCRFAVTGGKTGVGATALAPVGTGAVITVPAQ